MTDKKLTDNEIIKALEELLKELKSKKQLIVPEQGVKNLYFVAFMVFPVLFPNIYKKGNNTKPL